MIGARIKQARLLAGMTQRELSGALGDAGYKITAAAISKYEKEKSFPSAQFMLLASSVLNVPSTYFMHQPEKSVQWRAFRRHSNMTKSKQAAIKAYAADIAELQTEIYALLYPNKLPNLPTGIPVRDFESAEHAANRLRTAWELGNRPLDNLVQTAEDRGVVVIEWHDADVKFDGLSGWSGGFPVSVINTNRSTDRVRFNVAHEIGHLVMDVSDAERDEEELAHRFAAALLVSAEHAFHELGIKRQRLDWEELKVLKRKYGLSMAAWIRRARDLHIINENHYRELHIELSKIEMALKGACTITWATKNRCNSSRWLQRAVTRGTMVSSGQNNDV